MPLIEVTTNRTVCASIRMEEATASQVDQYAAFIKASADDVVDKALGYVFSKDRDFQDFLKTDEARKVPSLLRIRKSAPQAESPAMPKKPSTGVESAESVAVRKA